MVCHDAHVVDELNHEVVSEANPSRDGQRFRVSAHAFHWAAVVRAACILRYILYNAAAIFIFTAIAAYIGETRCCCAL